MKTKTAKQQKPTGPQGPANGQSQAIQVQKPAWAERFLDLYQSGVAHSFLLHFNVNDHVSPDAPISLVTYLAQLLKNREVVAVYSRDRGITFPLETMRRRALEILGMASQEKKETNPALAALQSVGAAPQAQQELPRNPAAALPLLDKLLRATNGEGRVSAVIIEAAELIIPDGPLATMSPDDRTALAILTRWGRDSEIGQAGNPVFLITGNIASLHSDLRAASNRYEAIEIPLPATPDRQRFIERYLERRPVTLAEGLTIEAVANATAGLSLLHVEDILLRAEARGLLTQALIWERKESIIRSEYGDVLEIIEPRFSFADIGGLAHVKQFFTRSVIRPILEGRRNRVPMGILMTGPAGTGKSIMAEAVAAEAMINAVKLRIGGQIASMWQGQGERNLEKALRAIEGLAPSLVFIDEIDQATGRSEGGGGSQQDSRIFQRLLEFMSDTRHRGDVVFLAATNRPDLLDAALRRPGRFDKKIPFLVPDQGERQAIFEVMAWRYLEVDYKPDGAVLAGSEGWTGAEIEAGIIKAAELIEDEALEPGLAIEQAVRRLRSSTADIQLMTLLAVQECNDPDLLPPYYREMLDNRAELAQQVEKAQGRQRREL